jgi:hypothetical protein
LWSQQQLFKRGKRDPLQSVKLHLTEVMKIEMNGIMIVMSAIDDLFTFIVAAEVRIDLLIRDYSGRANFVSKFYSCFGC